MQEVLNNLRDYLTPDDATKADLIQFLEVETTFIDSLNAESTDLSEVPIDVSDLLGGGTITFENLEDFLDALDSNTYMTADDVQYGESFNIYNLFAIDNLSSSPFIDDGFISFDPTTGNVQYSLVGTVGMLVTLSTEQFENYIIASVLQLAGFIGSDVVLHPVMFDDSNPNNITQFMQLYFGKVGIERDTDAGTISVTYNGSAAMREMGIEVNEYSEYLNDESTLGFPEPLRGEEDSAFFRLTGYYAFDDREDMWDWGGVSASSRSWSAYADEDLNDDFKSEDIDVLLEAAATAIESQSTSTEVALLYTNSAITEWGELNDVWDLIHQYVHDALQRASNNSA
ncbi:hypothetical protein AB1L42_01545 [Thalassoglobus sp. JC818]|uniref:hypothetical protein n=1 Tax=Thalassoglobus sp. JC818 TaxID=3232136 RepID=UPI003457C600